MKNFTFTVVEYSLIGRMSYPKTIKARTLQAAHKKMQKICGNRDWSWELVVA